MTQTLDLRLLDKQKPIHFIGIGGCGMNPIASILLELGYTISGSDLKPSPLSERLGKKGAHVSFGHHETNIPNDTQLIAYSAAVPTTNCERVKGQALGIQEVERASVLNGIMSLFKEKIAVTGTHGKTTTSSMLASVFAASDCDPTFITGSKILNLGTSCALGTSDYFIAESDESDGSFLHMSSNAAIITNIEPDHMEFFKTKENLRDYFYRFMTKVLAEPQGKLFINIDDPESVAMYSLLQEQELTSQCVTFTVAATDHSLPHTNASSHAPVDISVDFKASEIERHPEGISFQVSHRGSDLGRFSLPVFGIHNVYNALSVISLAASYGLPISGIQQGLSAFKGTHRRFQLIGRERSIDVYDDYGHHPTEIKTTLDSIKKSLNRRLVCVFQPHRYTRTRDMFEEFIDAFSPADHIVLTDIYAAHEAPIDGISSKDLAAAITAKNNTTGHPQQVSYIPSLGDIPQNLAPELKPDDIVLTMGAGDITTVAPKLVDLLRKAS